MKKRNIICLVTGVIALAVGAATTYAWFTSALEPLELKVNTAKIAIAETTIEGDITEKLPGETFDYAEWPFLNESTRESVVRFQIRAVTIQDRGGVDLERSDYLLELLNDPENIILSGINSADNVVYEDSLTGDKYIWLESGDQLDEEAFTITLTVPKELGGNILDPETEERDENRLDEQEAVITLKCSAYAVQGTYAAIADIFGTDVAEVFEGLYH